MRFLTQLQFFSTFLVCYVYRYEALSTLCKPNDGMINMQLCQVFALFCVLCVDPASF